MTWQGGKKRRESMVASPFARLKPLATSHDDPAKAMENLAQALSSYGHAVKINIRLVSGSDSETVEHWEVRGGKKSASAKRQEPKDADVVVVMRPETWTQIAQGLLAPYDALFGGKMRVGGDFAKAKAITRHLSDPSAVYVDPC
jgi:putative sterol carrier protein